MCMHRCIGEDLNILLCYTIERGIIVEAEVASMDDVICLCVARELVQLPQRPCSGDQRAIKQPLFEPPTSDICDTQHSCMPDLLHTTLVWLKRSRARNRASDCWSAVWKESL